MTPRLTPSIELSLDRLRYLRLDKRAIFAAERALCRLWGRQRSILTLFADADSLTLNDLAVILHQALLDDDPALTLEQVQDLMDFDKLPAIFTALFEAWNAATQPAMPTPPVEDRQDGPLTFHGASSGPSAEWS